MRSHNLPAESFAFSPENFHDWSCHQSENMSFVFCVYFDGLLFISSLSWNNKLSFKNSQTKWHELALLKAQVYMFIRNSSWFQWKNYLLYNAASLGSRNSLYDPRRLCWWRTTMLFVYLKRQDICYNFKWMLYQQLANLQMNVFISSWPTLKCKAFTWQLFYPIERFEDVLNKFKYEQYLYL